MSDLTGFIVAAVDDPAMGRGMPRVLVTCVRCEGKLWYAGSVGMGRLAADALEHLAVVHREVSAP